MKARYFYIDIAQLIFFFMVYYQLINFIWYLDIVT